MILETLYENAPFSACPCGSTEFDVSAMIATTVRVEVLEDDDFEIQGDEEASGAEWDDNSLVVCCQCGARSTVGTWAQTDATPAAPTPAPARWQRFTDAQPADCAQVLVRGGMLAYDCPSLQSGPLYGVANVRYMVADEELNRCLLMHSPEIAYVIDPKEWYPIPN